MKKYEKAFFILLITVTVAKLLYVGLSGNGLIYEEAYYWNYSQHPSLGYFDHPPMVAWVILLFTTLFGNTEFGVRAGAVLLASGLLFFTYLTGKRLYNEKAGFFASLTLSLIVMFSMYSTYITPDTPLFFFWALSLYLFTRAMGIKGGEDGEKGEEKPEVKWWIFLGIAMGCALLSKYTAVFLPFSFGVYLLWTKADKSKWKWLVISTFIGLAAFSPVIIWNFQNDFASFLFQTSNRFSSKAASYTDFPGYLALQAAFVTPFIFFALIYAMFGTLGAKEKKAREKFLLSASLPVFLTFTIFALKTVVKFNWPPPAYIAGAVLLASRFITGQEDEKKKPGMKKAAYVYMTFAMVFALLLNLLFYVQPLYPQILPALSKANSMAGWRGLAQRVKEERESLPDPGNSFVAGYGYQSASQLKFYGWPKEEIYSRNIFDEPALSYTMWQKDLSPLKGRDAIIVVGHYKKKEFSEDLLSKYFESFEKLEPYEVKVLDKKLWDFDIYKAHNYKGPEN